MFCSKCGKEMTQGNKFCSYCGAKVENIDVFCMCCGEKILPGTRFCMKCDKPQPSFNMSNYPLKKKRHTVFIVAITCFITATIITGALLIFLPAQSAFNPVTGQLVLEEKTHITDAAIGMEGGTIVVENENSALNGMTITVPQGAYSEQVNFSIEESDIVSHTFGENFTPITPLISVDNGELFAGKPLEVTIPIRLKKGQFAMGFYYNEEEGALEGIPLLEETDSSITLMTRHFSDIYIAMAEEGKILGSALGKIDTGFAPGKDDFVTSYHGGYLEPAGHCAGQCIAEMHYYAKKGRIGANQPLYGRFDNNGLGDTPSLWQDDAMVMRLCDVMQNGAMVDWNTGADIQEYHKFKDQHDDKNTFYAPAYAMMGTGKPQLVYCAQSNGSGAHMVLAYKIEGGVIYVADPNYPADASADRTIPYDPVAAPDSKLAPYYSAPSAEEAKKAGVQPYDIIAYYGMHSLVDKQTVESVWQDMLAGNLPGTKSFPGDIKITAFTGLKETDTGEAAKDLVPLASSLTLHEFRLKDTAASGGKLFFYVEYPIGMQDATFTVYKGDKEVWAEQVSSMPGAYYIPLESGENDVGVYFSGVHPFYPQKGYRFINFYRFKVIYDNSAGEAQTTAPPESAQPEQEFVGSWQMYEYKLLEIRRNADTMDIINIMFARSSHGFGSVEEFIYGMNKAYAHKLMDYRERHLAISKRADGRYTAEISGYRLVYDKGKQVERAYTDVFDQVNVSGSTITFEKPNNTYDFAGRDTFSLTLEGDTLTGTMITPFYYEDMMYYTPYPANFNPEAVYSFEAERVRQ